MPKIEIHFKGKIDASWSDSFQGLAIQSVDTDETCMNGELADKVAIYGVLSCLSSLGLPLISVKVDKEEQK